MKKSFLIISLFASALTLLNSCGKSAREDAQQSAKDNASAESAYNDILRQVDYGYDKVTDKTKSIAGLTCATYTFSSDDSVFPDTLTIDFGTGCEDIFGISRSGKIIAIMNGRYRNTGSVTTVTLENFKRNNKSVTGTKTITNLGPNSSGQPVFNIEVSNASVETEDGTASWTSSRTRTWTAGYNTPLDITDDAYSIMGTANGTNAKGNKFEIKITKPLTINIGCSYITEGTLEITPEDAATRTVDYGDGTCDDEATLKIRNKTYNITLRK